MPTSCSHYFREAIAGASRCGVDVDAVLGEIGLGHEQIQDPQWRGDLRLLARIVQLVIDALGDEFMGYLPGRSKPGTFAMMTNVVIVESSIEQAIRKGSLFYSFVTDAVEMSLELDDAGGSWTVRLARPELDPSRYYLEFWLSIWFRFWGWLAGEPLRLRAVNLDYEPGPGNRGELGLLFGIAPTVNASVVSLSFDAAFLRRSVVRTRQELKDFLAETPLGVMTPIPGGPDVAGRVKALVRPRDREALQFPAFRDVAAQLYLTEQTLRRRLQAERTSYRAIKQVIRQDAAERMLRDTDVPVRVISELTGYSEARAFVRAFHDWTGMSPTAYRRATRQAAVHGPGVG
jgi:AraC-like DNA-binding protein